MVGGEGDAPRIGPNAITRIAEALTAAHGPQACRRVFLRAGLGHHLATPPTAMVPEAEVLALHQALFLDQGEAKAVVVVRQAGRATGDYLLAHRIPVMAQRILGWLPAGIAARLFAKAIARHAWTFVGSGRFSVAHRGGLAFRVARSPLAAAVSAPVSIAYWAATFERLFAVILARRVRVDATGSGPGGYAFRLDWSAGGPRQPAGSASHAARRSFSPDEGLPGGSR